MTILLTGFLTTMALIVAIGPQSAWLLRQGLRRDRVPLAVAACLVGDIVLIVLGVVGVGVALEAAPWLLEVLRWVGVAYIAWFAVKSFRSAWQARRGAKDQRSDAVDEALTSEMPAVSAQKHGYDAGPSGGTATLQRTAAPATSRASAVAAAGLALSLLNPHALVDTLVVLGTMANSFGDGRWLFAAGAMLASVLWHTVLGAGSSALAGVLNRPRTWVVIDVVVGLTMLTVATMLALNGV
ncbi:LysE/ArgO family amino acid transporter [Nesterenkonia populi]|uniref:LysE/ArgO family amino acid transporter n=1 Tax=Nesterenkonia populi TaxID=1591087 RepID=UPI0011BE7ACC|nr:LysE family transporter [Nesterenkonia populi]